MATWSDLKIKLIETGDETGTWGVTTNANLNNVIEQAITGSATISFADANQVLTLVDSTDLQDARALRLYLTGTASAPRDLTVPNIQKFYIVDNDLTQNITVKNPTGAQTFTVPAGTSTMLFSTGTGVVGALSYFSGALTSFLSVITGGTIDGTSIGASTASTGAFTTLSATSATLTNPLPVLSGGTGVTTSTGTGNVVFSADPALSGIPTAPTATAGTNTTQIATTAFVTSALSGGFPSGGIVMWSGSIATIPSGWFLCNGANGTPDLRNRFIVGAGSTYAVAATGGSANAVLVSHTHTATVTDAGHLHAMAYSIRTGYVANTFNATYNAVQSTGTGVSTNSATTGITVGNSTEGVSATNANLPPYYALAYIMKG